MKLAKRIWMAAICVAGLALSAGAQTSVSIMYPGLSEPLPAGTTKYYSLTVDAGGGSATTKYLKTVKSSGDTSGNLSVYDAHLSTSLSLDFSGIWNYNPMDGETWTILLSPASSYVAIADLTDISGNVVDLGDLDGDFEAQDGAVLTGELSGSYRITVAAGATVTLCNAVVRGEGNEDFEWAGITCLGDATIVLEGENYLRGFYEDYPGLQAGPAGTTLTISGTGSLEAGSNGYGCGIGGGYELSCGNVAIEGGTIVAEGGYSAAGIGSGENGSCGDITILGGIVTATGGKYAPGIGSGENGSCGDIAIGGGVDRVVATAGDDAPFSVGPGKRGECGGVTVGGTQTGSIAPTPFVYVPSDDPYAISFDANDGEGSMAAQTFLPGVPQALSSNAFARAELLFNGWNTKSDGTGAFFRDGETVLFSESQTLYAQWAGYEVALTTQTGHLLLVDGQTLTGTGGKETHVEIAPGATVTLRDATILGEDDDDLAWAGLTCLGDATIVLEGTNVLRGFYEDYPGLQAGPEGTMLVIRGDGFLEADSNGYGCGIGGGYKLSCGDISIEGGTIVATGGEHYAAGIGSGDYGSCGDIAISGGAVTAVGGRDAAGIGSGEDGRCGDITISGGTVRATGGECGAGIGSGYDGGECGDIEITDGVESVVAVAGDEAPNSVGAGYDGYCGDVVVGGEDVGPVSDRRFVYPPPKLSGLADLSEVSEASAEAQEGAVLTGVLGRNCRIAIAAGATVTLSNAVVRPVAGADDLPWAGLTCLGSATILLAGTNAVASFGEGYPGIQAGPAGTTLEISGTGALSADGGRYAAGIGGGYEGSCGGITISGGTVTAAGGRDAAGIGSGNRGKSEDITISGGTVLATGGSWGSGIGSGYWGYCGDIRITGGTVMAKGGTEASGIGGGSYNRQCGDIEITDGATRVVALAGSNSPNSVGTGLYGDPCGTIRIGGTETGPIAEARFVYPADEEEREISGLFDLSTLSGPAVALDGAILTGTLPAEYRIAVAAGATVTLSNATIVAPFYGFADCAGLACLGDATIVLEGTNVVAAFADNRPGVQAGPDGSTLAISGTGALAAEGGKNAAGIGSGYDDRCGDIVVAGGVVTAVGGFSGAGIGAGYGGDCGDIEITGGIVTANGGTRASGIGSGCEGVCGDIRISGGTVAATGGTLSAGIGGGLAGECGSIEITDGVTLVLSASGDAECSVGTAGGGMCGSVTVGGAETGPIVVDPFVYRPSGTPFTVRFDANGGDGGMEAQAFEPGVPQNLSSNAFVRTDATPLFREWNTEPDGTGTAYRDGQLATFGDDTTLYAQWMGYEVALTPQTGRILLLDGQTLTGTGGADTRVEIAPGATVTLRDVTILGEYIGDDDSHYWSGIACLGDATVVLEGENRLRGFFENYPGLQAGPDGTTLVIRGPGSLEADSNGCGCGIGGGVDLSCGNIVIESGTIVATGGMEAAAGIGTGVFGACGDITISGGAVTAVGGGSAAGVGSGFGGECGDILIGNGVVRVVATPGSDDAEAIGAGGYGTCGTVTVGEELDDETDDSDGTRTLSHRVVYPDYLDDADEIVRENYLAWAAAYGFDDDGEHPEAFLLNAAPDDVAAATGALLRVTAIAVTETSVRLELACGIPGYRFSRPAGGDPSLLGNGFAAIEAEADVEDISDDWPFLCPARATIDENGAATVELLFSDWVAEDAPPTGFFRPSIRTFQLVQ